MNILITGINGFVGTNIVPCINNCNIYGLDVSQSSHKGVLKIFTWADLETKNIPEIDIIIHLAGKAHDVKKNFDEQEYFDINTGLTKKIYDFYLKSSATKFIFFSSVKAAADYISGNVLREDIIPNPVGPYGESKIQAENYILSKKSGEKKVYILRPCMIHGPNNKGNLNLLYEVVKKGIPWPLGSFENQRSFICIDNLSFIIDQLIKKDIPSGIYHIADDETLSTNELIKVICEGLGKKALIWKLNKELIISCVKIGSVLRLPLTMERLNKLTENYIVSNEKIKNALGITKLPVTAKDGMLKTIQSFQIEKRNTHL